MLGRKDKQRKRLFEILFPAHGADPVGIAIRQKILGVRMAARAERLEQRDGLADQVVAFLLVGRVALGGACGGGRLEGFGGLDQEDGEFKAEFRVVGLFGARAVEFELFVV